MKRILLLATMVCFNIGLGIPVYADNSVNMNGGYTVEGIPNDHQVDSNVSYFDLCEQPGETDQIKVKLINESDQDKTLKVQVTNGNTNANGLIDYTGELKDSISLKTPLTRLLKASEETVKVPKNSEIETTLTLTMPKETIEGNILGGIVVSDETKTEKNTETMTLKNKYNYTLGVVLKNSQETPLYKSDTIELKNIRPELDYGKKIVQVDFLNPTPYIFGEATVEGKIMNSSNKKVVQEKKQEKILIAPDSVFPFQFDWKKENIKSGTYTFEGTVKTKDKKWEFSKEFEIKGEQAKELNEKTVFKISIPQWLTTSAIFVCILMVISSSWVIVKNYKK